MEQSDEPRGIGKPFEGLYGVIAEFSDAQSLVDGANAARRGRADHPGRHLRRRPLKESARLRLGPAQKVLRLGVGTRDQRRTA